MYIGSQEQLVRAKEAFVLIVIRCLIICPQLSLIFKFISQSCEYQEQTATVYLALTRLPTGLLASDK